MTMLSGFNARLAVVVLMAAVAAVLLGGPARAATRNAAPALPAPSSANPSTAPADDLVTLNFPENMELKVLVDYVSQRLGFNVSYEDEQLSNQRVTLKAPTQVPVSALMGLLQSMLKMRGLTLVEGDQPGWKRIVPLAVAASPTSQPAGSGLASRLAGGPAGGPNDPIAQAFFLRNADAQRVDTVIKPFLSGSASSSFDVAEQHVLVVVDFASNMGRIAALVNLLDQPSQSAKTQFIPVRHADATQLALQMRQILTSRSRVAVLPGQAAQPVEVTLDPRTNQLVVVGTQEVVDEAARIASLLDVPVTEQQSPIRFYKLANATAADVLDTLRALEGEGQDNGQPGGSARASTPPNGAAGAGLTPAVTNGLSPMAEPGASGGAGDGGGSALAAEGSSGGGTAGAGGGAGGVAQLASPNGPLGAGVQSPVSQSQAAPQPIRTSQATVAADTNTNTIIVIAQPAVQAMYEQLIRNLDKRRPQVLIESTVVTLDTTNGFQFGVELSAHSHPGGKNSVVTFSNFGLSTPDPSTGQLTLVPGVGFNGALISSDIADAIVHALANSGRARISSAPRILVNDNATGILQDLSEQPYTSTNIGTSLSTTSFGGYAEAGTEITLTPHISEADYLQLDYEVSLSSFSGNAANGIPPPRQTDAVQSRITIPDGSTVIVGGLTRTNYLRNVDAIPLLGQIPILEYLFSNRTISEEKYTVFVFLRPIILRADQFEDLKFLSERDVKTAGVSDGYPSSEPMAIR